MTVSARFQVKFRCKLCGYLYSRKDTLKDHIRGKHNPCYSTTDLNALVEVVPPAPGSPNVAADGPGIGGGVDGPAGADEKKT
jgi:hypothetical protein